MYKTEGQKHRETKKTKPPKPKQGPNKTPFSILANHPFFFFFLLAHVCKAVLCWKHYKNSVFSRAQLLGITDSKTPFGTPSQNGTFATKSAILGFPLCLLKPPYVYNVLSLGMATKKDHFPKTDCCNEKALFFTVWTQIVFAYFSKKWHFYKKKQFSAQPPKNTIVLVFFLKFSFSTFFILSFLLFPTWKRQKQKVHIFFRKPFFDTLTNCPKNISSHPYTLFLFRPPKTLSNWGKTSKTKSWTDFQRNLGRIFNSKTPKSWTYFQLYSIYIYIYIWKNTKKTVSAVVFTNSVL